MPKREKVISKLEKEVQRTYSTKTTVFRNGGKVSEEINTHREPCVRIPIEIADEILALLKEQEATMVIESENMYTGLPIMHCPKCVISLDRYLYGRQYEGQINYCPMCGQAVMWE